jgi:outer dense fiber protein 2
VLPLAVKALMIVCDYVLQERASASRISDLEAQLTRANNLATQFRKSKDDLERRYHSRVHELQDRLEQANSTKRSLENYVVFLKSSYTSVFSDPGCHQTPGSPVSPLTH